MPGALRIPDAPCRGRTDLFFDTDPTSVAEAKGLCGGCSGQLECLEYAVETGANEGVWGGYDFRERRRLMRNLRARQLRAAEQVRRSAG